MTTVTLRNCQTGREIVVPFESARKYTKHRDAVGREIWRQVATPTPHDGLAAHQRFAQQQREKS